MSEPDGGDIFLMCVAYFCMGVPVAMLRAHIAIDLYEWHIMARWAAAPALEYWFMFWALWLGGSILPTPSVAGKQDKEDLLSWSNAIGLPAGAALGLLFVWWLGWFLT